MINSQEKIIAELEALTNQCSEVWPLLQKNLLVLIGAIKGDNLEGLSRHLTPFVEREITRLKIYNRKPLC